MDPKEPASADFRRELTELRHAYGELAHRYRETSARQEEERRILRRILDSITDGVVVADETGHFLHWNPVATRIVGIGLTPDHYESWSARYGVYRSDEVSPYPPEELPLVRAIRGEEVQDVDLFIRNAERPNGLWVSCAASPLLDEEGHPRGGVVVFRDVTPERQAKRAIQERDERLRRLTSELIVAEDRERQRIAGDLHDGLGQVLSLVLLKLTELQQTECPAREDVTAVKKLVHETYESVRTLTFRLSPPILHELGLGPAIQWLVEDLKERQGLRVSFSSRGEPVHLDERERILIYRTVRELLLNSAKHSGVDEARASLRWHPERLQILVEDEGCGFDPETRISDGHDGFGLFSIRERITQLGGCTWIDSKPGRGTRVEVELPLGGLAGPRPADFGCPEPEP